MAYAPAPKKRKRKPARPTPRTPRGSKPGTSTPLAGPLPHTPGSLEELVEKGTEPGGDKDTQIVNVLQGYFSEADNNRKGGLNPRDAKWSDNLDLYHNRFDFSGKAPWQSQEKMPEVPAYVDRFAGALKEALVSGPTGFYSVVDPYDANNDIAGSIKEMTDVWLSMCGRNQTGTYLDFSSVFEEQVKLGAMMAMSGITTWKGDRKEGRVAIETVDPRNVWLDHTYRNLYRNRRSEIDRHELKALVKLTDKAGRPLYNLAQIDAMIGGMTTEIQQQAEELTGSGSEIVSARAPIVLDEWIATVVDATGNVVADQALMVVANGRYLIRGPEKNPFWHGKDWMTFAPLVTVPLSVYGRTYMEDFGSLAGTFNELTNLILDAVRTSALKAWAVVPSMLQNPEQIREGLSPNKIFALADGYDPKDFAAKLDLGQLPNDAFNIWQSIKQELSSAADINEIGLGQFAPKGRTSATEIQSTQEGSSALLRSVAQTVETRWLNPTLDLVWKTGVQHASPSDPAMQAAVGKDMYGALMRNRKELCSRCITFQAQGISMLLQKSRMLRALLQLMSIIASNPLLMQAFLQKADIGKLIALLFRLSDIDMRDLTLSDREKQIAQVAGQLQAAQQQAGAAPGVTPPGNPPQNQMVQGLANDAVQTLGVGNTTRNATGS